MRRATWKALVVAAGLLSGGLCLYLIRLGPVGLSKTESLCRVELPAGKAIATATSTTGETTERLHVGVRVRGRGQRLRVSVAGPATVFYRSPASCSTRFSLGPMPAATYTLTLEQETGDRGGQVVVSPNPVGITGWQTLSRTYLALLVGSGVWALAARKSRTPRHRAISRHAFQCLVLGFVLVLLYPLLHEGGHALAAMLFGQFDLAGSDFWGIHGDPHSGLKAAAAVEPWQKAVVSFSGPGLPTLVGWALFGLWRPRYARRLREARPAVNLFLASTVVMCVFPFVAIAGCLVGVISDGDWRGFFENVPGPVGAMKCLLWGVPLVNALILWRVMPEISRCFRHTVAEMKAPLS